MTVKNILISSIRNSLLLRVISIKKNNNKKIKK